MIINLNFLGMKYSKYLLIHICFNSILCIPWGVKVNVYNLLCVDSIIW